MGTVYANVMNSGIPPKVCCHYGERLHFDAFMLLQSGLDNFSQHYLCCQESNIFQNLYIMYIQCLSLTKEKKTQKMGECLEREESLLQEGQGFSQCYTTGGSRNSKSLGLNK